MSPSANENLDDLFRIDVPYLPVSGLVMDGWVNHDDFYFTAEIEFFGNAASLRQGEAVNKPVGPFNLNSCGILWCRAVNNFELHSALQLVATCVLTDCSSFFYIT